VHQIRERGFRPEEEKPARTMVARLAAIREARGFTITSESDWQALASALLGCANPLLDARGRPAFVEMRNAELARKLMLDRSGEESNRLDGLG
jgi:hypothetical protein